MTQILDMPEGLKLKLECGKCHTVGRCNVGRLVLPYDGDEDFDEEELLGGEQRRRVSQPCAVAPRAWH